MERLLSHGKTPGTKLVSSCGNKEGKRADRSATNKPRGNCACIDHPALILSYFKWLAASWPFLSLGRGRVLPECPGICYLCGKAPAPSAMWSHHCHLERDFAAGTEHFTPAQQQLGAQDTLGCPMALARWALILLFLWRTHSWMFGCSAAPEHGRECTRIQGWLHPSPPPNLCPRLAWGT